MNVTSGMERVGRGSVVVEPTPVADPERDRQLVAGLRDGDTACYEELVRRHAARLLAVARRMLRDEELARDALQEGLLNAFRHIDRFREEACVATWLHRIVVNAALMRLRSARRRPEVAIEDLLPHFDETGHRSGTDFQRGALDPESALLECEQRARVRACIDALPETYRAVLLLRGVEDLSTLEVAEALGITPNAVKIRLHRARQALMTLLADPDGPHRAASLAGSRRSGRAPAAARIDA